MPARLVPPDEPSNSQIAEDETAWLTLISVQLADTRKSAENWRTGLVGLLGLVSIFSAVQGPSSISALYIWAAASVGMLLFLSVLSATAGTVASLQAAYGHPTVLSRAKFRQLGGSAGLQFEEARNAIAKLRIAQRLAFLSLALVVAAVGLAWYSPRPSSNTVKIVMRSGENLCGQLMSSGNGNIQVDSSSLGAVMINVRNLESIQVTKSC
jgi:hypothetical protein